MLIKSFNFLKRYFTIIFLLSLFLASFHHHDDGKIHNDCPIYILQTNLTNADTSPDNSYIIDLDLVNEAILENLTSIYNCELPRT